MDRRACGSPARRPAERRGSRRVRSSQANRNQDSSSADIPTPRRRRRRAPSPRSADGWIGPGHPSHHSLLIPSHGDVRHRSCDPARPGRSVTGSDRGAARGRAAVHMSPGRADRRASDERVQPSAGDARGRADRGRARGPLHLLPASPGSAGRPCRLTHPPRRRRPDERADQETLLMTRPDDRSPVTSTSTSTSTSTAAVAPDDAAAVVSRLSVVDRFLPVWIGAAMLVGLVLGRVVPGLADVLDAVKIGTTSLPIALGLLLMMYPVLAKVRYREIGLVTADRRMMAASLLLNWVVGPAVMFTLAWLRS